MENDEPKDLGDSDFTVAQDSSCSAVNEIILDYYRKFGRKRDIEQFFSLSTAQQDLSEPSSLFWKRMKEQNDSSDSGDKKTGSPTELCRISIKCSMDNPHTSKAYDKNTDSDTESPPIVSDDVPAKCLDSGDESNKSDDEQSHKSIDMTLDTSLNRPHSPTSSITSQRKLEWDSLADVGYGNESDRKNSASSLSTLERLALHQQYSNNDTKQNSELGVPTAHSTPLDQTESRSKIKKDGNKKTSKFCKKDVDIMEVNIPTTSDITNQPINVNLTKHISFNVERDGGVKMDNMSKHISVSQDNLATEAPKDNVDKEIQTTLPRPAKDKVALPTKDHSSRPRFPILINLNTLRNRNKKRKKKLSRPRKKGTVNKENIPQEKSINQESDAESFEYMPGHMYNPNKVESKGSVLNVADNKSSLESSAGHTTESSKDLQCTFTKELEKSIDLLKLALQHRYKDASLKKKLIKDVVQSLVQTNYKNDGSSNDLMFGFKQNNQTPSSTSESNNNLDNKKPKMSILHMEKFNSGEIATTSQSAPNLPTISSVINLDKPPKPVNISSTDSDFSYKSKYLSEVFLANSSSEEIYKKYLLALKKENIYKKKLKEQELLLRQKITQPFERECQADVKEKSNLNHLIKDLTKNNYADGSGDASNACHSSSNVENGPAQRSKSQSHTVFTLSGSNDFKKNKKLRNRLESEINYPMQASSSTQCQGCCAYRRDKIVVTDSSVQVNFDSQCRSKTENIILELNTPLENEKVSNGNSQENIKYVCLCTEKPSDVPDNFLIYRCSRMPSKCIMVGSNIKTDICLDGKSENTELAYNTFACENKDLLAKKNSTTSTQSSQTHFSIPQFIENYNKVMSSSSENRRFNKNNTDKNITLLKKASSNTCRSTILTQTEISIDPKVLDPTISDVKIIENEVCYDKNSEQEKNISDVGSNENKEENNKTCKDAVCTQAKNKVFEATDEDSKRRSQYKKLEENDSKLISLQNLQPQSNFTIPILGTNMTLKVSLDSRDSQEKKTDDIKPAHSQQSLKSNDFESLKSVENNYCTLQSENLRQKQTECVSVQTSNIGENKDINENKKVCYSEASAGQTPTTSAFNYESVDMGYCNTYPKENIPKTPFLRSNTDTGKMKIFDPSLFTDKKINIIEKSFKEPLLKSQGDQDNFLKKSLPRSKTKYNKNEIDVRQNIIKYIKDKKSEKETSEKPLLTPEPNKKEFYSNPQTSIAIKEAEPPSNEVTPGTLEKPLLRSDMGSDKKDYFDRNTSIGTENENSKEKTLKKPLVTSNTDSNKKEFINRSTSMSKYSDSSKEGTFKKPLTLSKPNLNNKEHTSTERKYSYELACQSNIDANKISTAVHRKHVDTQYDYFLSTQTQTKETTTEITDNSKSSNETSVGRPKSSKNSENTNLSSSNTDESKISTRDPLLDIIRDITKRYSKKEVDKGKRKKCYAEIIAVLNYLLDTSETTENESTKVRNSSASEGAISANRSPRRSKINEKPRKALKKDTDCNACTNDLNVDDKTNKTYKDQSVQLSPRKSKENKCCGESTDCLMSTDIHSTSTDYTARKTQHKLKHQCCKSHCRKCDVSSSSSVTCEPCKHRCYCRGHKNHRPRNSEKTKKCVAYNLILQTSDSVASEEMDKQRVKRHLKNIIVKVPSKRRVENMQFKEVAQKIERELPRQFTKDTRNIPQGNEVSSTDNVLKNTATCTIRDYLEQNRPNFVERSTQRQSCLKMINEARASERAAKREVLSAHVADIANQDGDLRRLAELLGKDLRTRKLAPKFISEKEMKKHSEKIYNSLPEMQRKKEETKKERVKKTNLLMANIFKKNLQRKTLQGAVNLSNYSAVIKI